MDRVAEEVYVSNHESDTVSQYDVVPGGALAPKTRATVPAGDGPVAIAVAAATPGATRPGKGCGDRNHLHERRGDCKKPPR
jgi:hypothetical protein